MIRRIDNLSAEAVRHAPLFARATAARGNQRFATSQSTGRIVEARRKLVSEGHFQS